MAKQKNICITLSDDLMERLNLRSQLENKGYAEIAREGLELYLAQEPDICPALKEHFKLE